MRYTFIRKRSNDFCLGYREVLVGFDEARETERGIGAARGIQMLEFCGIDTRYNGAAQT